MVYKKENFWGKKKKEKITEILNDNRVKNALKNLNKNINESTMKIVQENLQNTAAGATVIQDVKITGLKSKGSVKVGAINQNANIKISLSSLVNTEMKQELVNETMNKLQTKLKEQISMTQKQAQDKGEQIVSDAITAISDTIQSIIPSNSTSIEKTSIKNLFDIESDTELQNIVENAVNLELMNKTINDIANTFVGTQKTEISDITAGGNIVVSGVNQEIVSEQITESISNSGTANEILSKVANVSVADIEEAIDTAQEIKIKEEGTLEGLSKVTSAFFDGISDIIGGPMYLVFAIIGFIVAIMLLMKLAGGGGQPMMPPPMMPPPRMPMPTPMMYGRGKIKNIYNILMKLMKKGLKNIMKYKQNILIILLIGLILILSLKKKETFKVKSDVKISSNGKYVINEKPGSNKLCLKGKKNNAFKFNLSIKDQNMYIIKDKKYVKIDGDNIVFDKYDFVNDDLYKFTYDKNGKLYRLKNKDKYVGIENNCLILVENKDKSKQFKFTK
jgi:hypothetical protein